MTPILSHSLKMQCAIHWVQIFKTLIIDILMKYKNTYLNHDTCNNQTDHLQYSGTSIYRSRNDRFPACTVRHFWSRIKFHINNVIYSRIHRSPNYRFTALIVCKSRSRRSISRMDRLKKKKLKRSIYYLLYLLFGL